MNFQIQTNFKDEMLNYVSKPSCKADSIDEHTYIEFIFIWSFDIHVFPWRISNLFIMSQSLSVMASSYIHLYDIIKFHIILSPKYTKKPPDNTDIKHICTKHNYVPVQ